MTAELLIEELSKLDPKTWVSVIVADDEDEDGNLDAETGRIYELRDIVQTGDGAAAFVVDAAFGERLDDDEVAYDGSTAMSESRFPHSVDINEDLETVLEKLSEIDCC